MLTARNVRNVRLDVRDSTFYVLTVNRNPRPRLSMLDVGIFPPPMDGMVEGTAPGPTRCDPT